MNLSNQYYQSASAAALPVLTTLASKTIGLNLVSVSPMPAPSGQLFYMDTIGIQEIILDKIARHNIYVYAAITLSDNEKYKWKWNRWQFAMDNMHMTNHSVSELPIGSNYLVTRNNQDSFDSRMFEDIYIIKCVIPAGTKYKIEKIPDPMIRYMDKKSKKENDKSYNKYYSEQIQFVEITKKVYSNTWSSQEKKKMFSSIMQNH